MNWLNEWPEQFRPVLEKLVQERGYTAIHKIRELSGGGGAETFLAAPEGPAGIPNRIIVKLGPSEVLDRDLEGFRVAMNYFQEANYTLETEVKEGNWRCLPMEIAGGEDGIIFRDFYQGEEDPRSIADVIESLFLRVLRRKGLKRLDIEATPQNVFKLHRFDNTSAMALALRDIGDDVLTLVEWWEKARDRYGKGSYRILSHGDLHAGNIIVSGGKPYVIDFGRTGQKHVMFDLAKFEREIRMFLIPPDQAAQFEEVLKLSESDPVRTNSPELQKACLAIEAVRKVARESVWPEVDWEFEYGAALLAQFLFAAANSRLDESRRRAALSFARTLRDRIEERLGRIICDDEKLIAQRKGVLWRLAYAFLRLDQLPSGGWGKTLAGWMEALWEGEQGEIARNPEMRTKGGTDLTGYAFYHYVEFFRKHFDLGYLARMMASNGVAERVHQMFESKIDQDGGIGLSGRSHATIRVHHTLMGLVAFMIYGKATNYSVIADKEIDLVSRYLVENLKSWEADDSHCFGMFAVLVKLAEMLNQQDQKNQFDTNPLEYLIEEVMPRMKSRLNQEIYCDPKPKCGLNRFPTIPFFTPYANFWRMERSNFLMCLPHLVSDDGQRFLVSDSVLLERCAQCLKYLLDEISIPFDPANPTASLFRYHRDFNKALMGNQSVPTDWGLSAELAAVLGLPAIRKMLQSYAELERKQSALHLALLHTFDAYHQFRNIFRFTHGVSFSRYLQLVEPEILSKREIEWLDNKIWELCSKGVTENGLDNLLRQIITKAGGQDDIRLSAIRDLLVEKLGSGEHTPDGKICSVSEWEPLVEKARETDMTAFYNGPGGREYAERYGRKPINKFVRQIDDFVVWEKENGKYVSRKALDVGCGPGQYAKLLEDSGFEVVLVDNSWQMLKMAKDRLGLTTPPPVRDIYKLSNDFAEQSFDVIFACAMMVHVPLEKAKGVYQSFYQLLKPGGLLFVNFKIGDHSLISMDGRYFQYYRDHHIPMNILQETGFTIEEMTMRWNKRNLYNDPKEIRWANFYCRRPESHSGDKDRIRP